MLAPINKNEAVGRFNRRFVTGGSINGYLLDVKNAK